MSSIDELYKELAVKPPPDAHNCESCSFYREDEDRESGGHCHRYPPGLVGNLTDVSNSSFPDVFTDDWCGEWVSSIVVSPDAGIDTLHFSVRTANALDAEKVGTVDELAGMSAIELMRIRNIGKTSLNEIRGKLAAVGRKLRGE